MPTPAHAYRALLWDNDGVLVDTERWYYQATREVLATVGVDLTPELYFDHFLASSKGTDALVAGRGLSDRAIAELRTRRNDRYKDFLARESLAIHGVESVLAALRPRYTMGIVTSSRRDHFEAIHQRTGFLRHFDFVITSDDCERTKPDPEPYLRAVARAGVPAAECLAIEDAPRGLEAACAAGLDCWVIATELSRRAAFRSAKRTLAAVRDVAEALLGPGGMAAPGVADDTLPQDP